MNSTKEIQSIWEYHIKSEYLSEFINTYAPDGDWVKLFQKCPGYIKTELKSDTDDPHRFVTIDYWQSYSAFSSMKQTIGNEYEKLDKKCEKYTLSENHLGLFGIIDSCEINT